MIGLVVVGSDISNLDDVASAKALAKVKEVKGTSCELGVVH